MEMERKKTEGLIAQPSGVGLPRKPLDKGRRDTFMPEDRLNEQFPSFLKLLDFFVHGP